MTLQSRPPGDLPGGRLLPATPPSRERGWRGRRAARLTHRRALLVGGLVSAVCAVGGGLPLTARAGLTARQWLFVAHSASGIVLVHAAAGGVATLLPGTSSHLREWLRRASAITLVAGSWSAVLLGTWSGYPAYQATPPDPGDLAAFPQAWLRERPELSWWDTFAMAWKVQIGWVCPPLATAVATAVLLYGSQVARDRRLRVLVRVALVVAAASAAVAALIGVVVNILAPNDYLRQP